MSIPINAVTLREQVPNFILHDNLFGVDLSPEAVEITQLSLGLARLSEARHWRIPQNIVRGNSLVTDPEIDSMAMHWEDTFSAVFSRQERGFDCVIGNPPWERMKLQEREFFDILAPDIAAAVDAATRCRKLIADMRSTIPNCTSDTRQQRPPPSTRWITSATATAIR